MDIIPVFRKLLIARMGLAQALKDGAKLKGLFEIEVFDKYGNFISGSKGSNVVTDEGLNHLLNVVLHDTAKIATWYCECFEDDFTPDGDETYAVPGYTEWESYDEATRPEFDNAASASKSTTNSANKAVFTANATKTLYGASIVGNNTKGDEAGGSVLFCAARFGSSQPVVDDNVVNLTYTISAADDAA